MEHEIEKRIREKVLQAEAAPVAWSKLAVWQSVREAEQPRRRNGFRYVAVAASVLMGLSFFSDGLLQTQTPHVIVRTTPEGIPQSPIQHERRALRALPKAEHPEPLLTQTSHGDLRGTSSHRYLIRNSTSTSIDTLPHIAGITPMEEWTQQHIRIQSTDTVASPVQHKKVIHAIVGILETSSKDTLVERKQKVSRLKLFKRHERDLEKSLNDQEKSMTARIN